MHHIMTDMKLYHQYNKARRKEHDFLKIIIEKFPSVEYIKENYDLSIINFEIIIDLAITIKSLQSDKFYLTKRNMN